MFDETIKQLREWLELREQVSSQRISAFQYLANEGRAASPIILKEDTFVELGHPAAGSCSLCAATKDASLVTDGVLTIIGPDIPESQGRLLPFAQLILACCRDEIGETSLAMDRIVHSASQFPGYMLRSVPDRIWARVSNNAARSGFSLKDLGARLYGALLRQCQEIIGVEIFFVTSSKSDIMDVEGIVQPVRQKLGKIQTYERLPDGSYECTTGLDCTECPEKTVCDNIRDVITIRKGDRVITFERNKDSD